MNEIISEDELTDMFGEGGKEEVKEFYEELNENGYSGLPDS